MKTIQTLLAFLFIGAFQLQAQNIQTDASTVSFSLSNMGIRTVEGTFSNLNGTVVFNPADLANAKMEVCIDAATIDTDSEKRDEHLKNEDFFEVATYPSICFNSTMVKATENGYEVTGELTMHGVTQLVTIPFTVTDNTFSGTLVINRKDFKVGVDYGNFMVGEEVNINITAVVE